MKKIYTGYRCAKRGCRKELILLTSELEQTLKKDRYISCPYCSSRRLLLDREVDDLRELMGVNKDTYKRVSRRVRQK